MFIEIPELNKIKTNWLRSIYTHLQQAEIAELVENEVWITANRRQIPVRDMTTSHINNCLNCWEGRGKSKIPAGYLGGKQKWVDIFNKELLNRQ